MCQTIINFFSCQTLYFIVLRSIIILSITNKETVLPVNVWHNFFLSLRIFILTCQKKGFLNSFKQFLWCILHVHIKKYNICEKISWGIPGFFLHWDSNFPNYFSFLFLKLFYCCSITLVCIFSPPQPNPPPSPASTLPLGFVHVSFIVLSYSESLMSVFGGVRG